MRLGNLIPPLGDTTAQPTAQAGRPSSQAQPPDSCERPSLCLKALIGIPTTPARGRRTLTHQQPARTRRARPPQREDLAPCQRTTRTIPTSGASIESSPSARSPPPFIPCSKTATESGTAHLCIAVVPVPKLALTTQAFNKSRNKRQIGARCSACWQKHEKKETLLFHTVPFGFSRLTLLTLLTLEGRRFPRSRAFIQTRVKDAGDGHTWAAWPAH